MAEFRVTHSHASVCLLLLLVNAVLCIGQDQKNVAPTGSQVSVLSKALNPSATDANSPLQVTISPSTAHIVRGAAYSLDAQIKNVSKQPVGVDLRTITLAAQPELAPKNQNCAWFFGSFYSPSIARNEDENFILQPQERVTVFFNMRTGDNLGANTAPICRAKRTDGISNVLNFVPGQYVFELTGRYKAPNPVPGSSESTSTGWSEPRVFSQNATLEVGIDQASILLFAALGGFFAFLVMALRHGGDFGQIFAEQMGTRAWFWKVAVFGKNAFAAAFLSAAVTIVASRLSDTQFPIKVSVNDFWGALTVGFVSYFVGGKFIDKLANLRVK
jgi:hypothetical protein